MERLSKSSEIFLCLFFLFIMSCTKEGPVNNASDEPGLVSGLRSTNEHGRPYNDVLSNQIVLDWNYAAFEAAGGAAEANPLLASRSYAMVHIAIHDALNAIVPVYESYIFQQQAPAADARAAVASAAYTVLKASWAGMEAMLDAKLAQSLSAIPAGTAKTAGIALGTASGNAILALRAGDGAFQDPIGALAPSTTPGVYVAVPPFTFAFAPFWKTMQLFSLQTHDQFRSAPPPSLNSPAYTRDFNEVKAVGSINSTVRTADQTAYGAWWYEYSDMGWNRVARTLAANESGGLFKTARLFALMNMAMADAYTAGWDAKYYYNFWRPYTAIRAAATDGNPLTAADATWETLLPTPPVPDYPSTHSTLGNAAATVLAHFYGTHSPFSMLSTSAFPGEEERSFVNLKKAADENADSRVVVGIHFRFATVAGQKMGDEIGRWTLKHHLEPLH